MPVYGAELFVSPSGSDQGDGSSGAPYATLEAARDAVRARFGGGPPAPGVVVWLREGTYARSSSFELGEEDSGTEGAPVVYRAYPGESARLIGGKPLPLSAVQPLSPGSPLYARFDATVRSHLVQIDLAAQGVSDYGTLGGNSPGLELFLDGERRLLARWPNVGEVDAGQGVDAGFSYIPSAASNTQFTYAGDRPSRWGSPGEVWLHGFWGNWWFDNRLAVRSIDTGSRGVTVSSAPSYGILAGQAFYAYNVVEELDTPGEWYLDRARGVAYLYPPEGFAQTEVIVSLLEAPLVKVRGASHLTLQDLELAATRSDLVSIEDGAHVTVEGCSLHGARSYGVVVKNGTDHRVSRCHVHDTGAGGVSLTGGDRPGLTPARHAVEDCTIHDFGEWTWTYQPGVKLSGVGLTARHNELFAAPHSAILFGGNEHVIERNDVHDVCRYWSDAGAIYGGRDWGSRGIEIRHNFVHDISSSFEGLGAHGIYLDDCLSGVHVMETCSTASRRTASSTAAAATTSWRTT